MNNKKRLGVSRIQKGGDNGEPLNPKPKIARPAPPQQREEEGGPVMSEKHTPGPWQTNTKLYGYWFVTMGKRVICSLNTNFPPEANACLIAAAPDLLAVCKEALKKCPFPVGAALLRERIVAAVAKAENTHVKREE